MITAVLVWTALNNSTMFNKWMHYCQTSTDKDWFWLFICPFFLSFVLDCAMFSNASSKVRTDLSEVVSALNKLDKG